ncbi:hypothetical protein LY78DRAFT_213950 [Colletotrichum sublineola]|nr:hypothetical protein LY78DRAFT_213950 [Colletotrichum sublineola]
MPTKESYNSRLTISREPKIPRRPASQTQTFPGVLALARVSEAENMRLARFNMVAVLFPMPRCLFSCSVTARCSTDEADVRPKGRRTSEMKTCKGRIRTRSFLTSLAFEGWIWRAQTAVVMAHSVRERVDVADETPRNFDTDSSDSKNAPFSSRPKARLFALIEPPASVKRPRSAGRR